MKQFKIKIREADICILHPSSLQYVYMQNLLTEANLLAQTIGKVYKPERIILFGSAARGDYHANSDIDLLIIKNSDKKKHIE